ncbi:hypothetical protein G9444_1192 [Rhodococcus erythropolis]|uniref:Thiolase N-terminal domain-containing protein n=1 Tax=Rhodococcus erythropolis TaxID=1833 RepID=A0A6G9CP10_RHOER|nr:hypothetical protein G9444_1192 [Rhodococcus erythropolis]
MTSKARSNAKPAAPRTAPAAAAAKSAGQRRPVAIVGGNRIPFARSDKAYAQASNQDMFTATLDGLVSRFNLQGEKLGMVVGGAVLKHSRDFNLIRESVLGSALSPYTSAYDLQQACGTGLQSIIAVGDAISAGPHRFGHRRRHGHHVRRPDRRQRSGARVPALPQPREVHGRPHQAARQRPCGHARPRNSAQRRASHRQVDG